MIGGWSIVPNKFKDCKCWQQRLLWIVVIIIEFFVATIPNWIDSKFRK